MCWPFSVYASCAYKICTTFTIEAAKKFNKLANMTEAGEKQHTLTVFHCSTPVANPVTKRNESATSDTRSHFHEAIMVSLYLPEPLLLRETTIRNSPQTRLTDTRVIWRCAKKSGSVKHMPDDPCCCTFEIPHRRNNSRPPKESSICFVVLCVFVVCVFLCWFLVGWW